MAPFVLDANILIQNFKNLYSVDVFPKVWNKLSLLAYDAELISIKKVKSEIYPQNDDLVEWCKVNLPNSFFKDDTNLIGEYSQLMNWANNQNYNSTALNDFADADKADAWLVAYCMKYNTTLVTYELSNNKGKKNIKIPDVANEHNVKCINFLQMLRELNISF